jgi:hypothetical protein
LHLSSAPIPRHFAGILVDANSKYSRFSPIG